MHPTDLKETERIPIGDENAASGFAAETQVSNNATVLELANRISQVCDQVMSRFGISPESIDEVAQDVFLQAYKLIQQGQAPNNNFEHWIYSIVIRKVSDHARRLRSQEQNKPIDFTIFPVELAKKLDFDMSVTQQAQTPFNIPSLPPEVRTHTISHCLIRANQIASEWESYAQIGDLIELSNAGFALVAVLDDLWKLRGEREADWGDLLNLLQGALAKEEFERFSIQQCTAIKDLISKHLAADEVTLDDLENSIKLLRETGLDPWRGISGTLSE